MSFSATGIPGYWFHRCHRSRDFWVLIFPVLVFRNPWISEQQQLECRESQSTNSSSSGRTYHQQQQHRGPGPSSSLWLPESSGTAIPYNHHQLYTGGHFPLTDQIEGTQGKTLRCVGSNHLTENCINRRLA